MKRNYIGKETLDFELKYYILEEEVEVESSKYVGYGIEIEKQDNLRVEKSQIKDITTDKKRIYYIVNLLMKNSVTPIHLHDVIEDIL